MVCNMNNHQVKGLSLIVTFVERNKGKKIIKYFNKIGCTFHTVFIGKGTAPKEIYEYLGIGVVEKDVIFSVVDSASKDFLLKMLIQKFKFNKPGNGVACSIPIDAIDSMSALKAVLGKEE